MKRGILVVVMLLAAVIASPLAGWAEEPLTFDAKSYTCGQLLKDMKDPERKRVMGMAITWGIGYVAALAPDESSIEAVSQDTVRAFAGWLVPFCQTRPPTGYIEALKEMAQERAEKGS